MKILLLLIIISCAYSAPSYLKQEQYLTPAKKCDINACKLPDCLCSSTSVPGGLNVSEIPQLVLLTFDDAVSVINIDYYRQALFNRKNPDGCPIGATFFVSHEHTNYSDAHELWSRGFEIALHSITHETPQDYWKNISVEGLKRQFADQLLQFEEFAYIPKKDIRGIRLPFLQHSGDNVFEMLKEIGLKYDCSWPSRTYIDVGLWPYTLDYKSIQDCPIGPCPKSSISGIWEIPMIDWLDNSGSECAMVDACRDTPTDVEGVFQFILRNFNRHYQKHRSPFGFYVHAAWFLGNPNHFTAYLKFLDYLQGLNDVYIVNAQRALQWVQKPSTLANLKNSWSTCQATHPNQCLVSTLCQLKTADGSINNLPKCGGDCPDVYPWLNNPLGNE